MAVVGTNNWTAIAYGNGKYVAAGTNGYATTSADGVNWTRPKQIQTVTGSFRDIAYCNNEFIAVGQSSKIAFSTDGETWSVSEVSTSSYDLSNITYGHGIYVISTNDYCLCFVSNDKSNWTSQCIYSPSYGINKLKFFNGKFIAVGGSSSTYGLSAISIDCVDWTVSTDIQRTFIDVAYAEGIFVAVGHLGSILTSKDGMNWTFKDTNNTWKAITYVREHFIIVGTNGYISSSTDGETWTTPAQVKDASGGVITNHLFGIVAMP